MGLTSSGSSSSSGEIQEINDINITPFVDVVLVLLVIFMVTAPMMMKDLLNLQLPESSTADSQNMGTLAVVITKESQLVLNGELVTIETLRKKSREAAAADPKTQVVISADQDSRHGELVKVIDAVKSSGLNNFAIQVEKISAEAPETSPEGL
jgi:biopolymer transport protein ExbD